MSVLDKIPRHLLERAAADPRNGKAAVNALQAALASRGPTTPRKSAEASGRDSSAAAGKGKKRGEMNRTERAFADVVLGALVAAGEIDRWEYEALTLRIPNVGAVTPDFVGYRDNQIRVLFEVKGAVVHEASVLRMKAHAAARPWWRWLIYRRTQEGWAVYWDSGET